MLRLLLLGTPAVHADGRELTVSSQKALALLCYLAADPARSFTRTQLGTLLWEESSERDGRNALSTVLTRLRQTLPLLPIRAEGDTLGWQASADLYLDTQEFALLSRATPAEDLAARRARLARAAALYRSPFLDGFGLRDSAAYDDWLRDERARWQLRALAVLEDLASAEAALGNYPAALAATRRALAVDPLQERVHRTLIQLLAETGDRAAALAHYRLCCEILERELGVAPDPETTALAQRVREGAFERRVPAAVTPDLSAAPTPRLAARLSAARRQSFVGRQAELNLFADALAQPEPPFLVLHLVGPGGGGKSTLLAEFARLAAEADVPVFALDARNIQPTPEGLLFALASQLGTSNPLVTLPPRLVLLLDTYEQLAPIERWLCDSFLPQLPIGALVVLAGRNPPSLIWRADPGWQSISRVLRLPDLSASEAADYLVRRAVPEQQHPAVLRLTHGYPLGLSLAADLIQQQPNTSFDLDNAPDIVRTLLERFVETVPSPEHRAALEAMGQVRVLDEPLLAALLDRPEARALFDWLARLSFVSASRRGLFPHDLAREVLAADLRWRNAHWYRTIHDRARTAFLARFNAASSQEQPQALLDLIFLHENPLLRAIFSWHELGGLVEDRLRPGDVDPIIDMVRRHEGPESAAVAAYWLERQPGGVTIFRDTTGAVQGVNIIVTLRSGDSDGGDPCAAAVLRAVAAGPPLAADQYVMVDRFWLDRDAYQGISASQGMIFVAAIRTIITAPRLAASFHVLAQPEIWGPAVEAVLFDRLPTGDFAVGGRHYALYQHDWRAQTPTEWFSLLATRELR